MTRKIKGQNKNTFDETLIIKYGKTGRQDIAKMNFEFYAAFFIAAIFGIFSVIDQAHIDSITLFSLLWYSILLLPGGSLFYMLFTYFWPSGEFFNSRVLFFYIVIGGIIYVLIGICNPRNVLTLGLMGLAGYALGGSFYWMKKYREFTINDNSH